MSCSTKATRSAGASASSTTSSARPTLSASSASRSGSAARCMTGGGLRLAVQRLLAPRLARAQRVEADAGDHRGQPAAEIVDAGGIGAAQPQPGFLHGIIRLARRAQHAVGDPLQMAAVGLELLGQPFFFFHRSHSPIALRHSPDGRDPADVTKEMIMQARMTNPVFVVPEALKALMALGTSIAKGGVPNTHPRAGAPARQPDQRLQLLRRDACARPEEGRREGRAPVHRRRLARGALLHRRRARGTGADRGGNPASTIAPTR